MTILTDEWGGVETLRIDNQQVRQCREIGIEAVRTGRRLFGDGSYKEWTLIHEDRMHGDKAFQIKPEKHDKVFAVETTVNKDLPTVFSAFWDHIEQMPMWNHTVKEFKILEHYSDKTRLVYRSTHEAFGGLVSSRDFIDVNNYRQIDGAYYLAGRSVLSDAIPVQKGTIRAETLVGWMRIAQSPHSVNATHVCAMACGDLKGMLPKSVIERASSHYMIEYIRGFKKYIENQK